MKSETNLTILTQDQAARVDRAKSYWQSEITSGRGVGIYAFMLGAELSSLKTGLKDEAGHGQWMAFRQTHFPEIPHRTATERMALFSKLAESANLPAVGNIKLLGDGSVPKDYADKIAEAWREHGDGKTITRFMRDTGVLRQKKAPAYHPPSLANALNSPDPEPAWSHVKGDLLLFTIGELREAPTKDLRDLQTILQAVSKLVATALQERKSAANR